MRSITLLLFFCLALISCEKKSDNMTVLLNQSGTLKIHVKDFDNSGVKGANISVYSSIPDNERIYNDSTDVNGTCNLGKVLQGQYEYFVNAKKENRIYSYGEHFQVIAGDEKSIEVNPYANKGNARVKIINRNSEPITGVNVALIPHSNYYNTDYRFQDLLEESYATEITDSDGWVEFIDMPASSRYSMVYSTLVYIDSNNYDYPLSNNHIIISQGLTRNITIETSL